MVVEAQVKNQALVTGNAQMDIFCRTLFAILKNATRKERGKHLIADLMEGTKVTLIMIPNRAYGSTVKIGQGRKTDINYYPVFSAFAEYPELPPDMWRLVWLYVETDPTNGGRNILDHLVNEPAPTTDGAETTTSDAPAPGALTEEQKARKQEIMKKLAEQDLAEYYRDHTVLDKNGNRWYAIPVLIDVFTELLCKDQNVIPFAFAPHINCAPPERTIAALSIRPPARLDLEKDTDYAEWVQIVENNRKARTHMEAMMSALCWYAVCAEMESESRGVQKVGPGDSPYVFDMLKPAAMFAVDSKDSTVYSAEEHFVGKSKEQLEREENNKRLKAEFKAKTVQEADDLDMIAMWTMNIQRALIDSVLTEKERLEFDATIQSFASGGAAISYVGNMHGPAKPDARSIELKEAYRAKLLAMHEFKPDLEMITVRMQIDTGKKKLEKLDNDAKMAVTPTQEDIEKYLELRKEFEAGISELEKLFTRLKEEKIQVLRDELAVALEEMRQYNQSLLDRTSSHPIRQLVSAFTAPDIPQQLIEYASVLHDGGYAKGLTLICSKLQPAIEAVCDARKLLPAPECKQLAIQPIDYNEGLTKLIATMIKAKKAKDEIAAKNALALESAPT